MASSAFIMLIITSFFLHINAQELICFNPELAENPAEFLERNPQQAAAITSQSAEMFQDILGNLTIEEAADKGIDTIVEVSLGILRQGIEDGEIRGELSTDLIAALFQGFLNFTNGPQVMSKMLEDPINFGVFINKLVSGFNSSCIDEQGPFILSLVVSLIGDVLDEPFLRERVGDIIVSLTVNDAIQNDRVDVYQEALSGLIETIEGVQNLAGAVPLFEGQLQDLYSTSLLAFATQIGLETDPQEIANFVSGFWNKMQQSLELNDVDFLNFLVDLMQKIVAQIS